MIHPEGFIPLEGKGLLKIYPLATSREQDAIYFPLGNQLFSLCFLAKPQQDPVGKFFSSLYVQLDGGPGREALKKYGAQLQMLSQAPNVSL